MEKIWIKYFIYFTLKVVTQAPIIALVVSVSLWEYKDGESMSYIIDASRYWWCSTVLCVQVVHCVQFSLCTQKPVPLSGYYTYMVTTIDQCILDSGGERWSGFSDKRGEFHLHIFSILRFIFLSKDLLVYWHCLLFRLGLHWVTPYHSERLHRNIM